MNNAKSILQKHKATFRYDKEEIPFYFWSHLSGETDSVDTIIFLGSGQRGKITKWVVGNAPAGTVVVEGLPHKQADRSADDLKEFAHQYTNTAFLAVLNTFNLASASIVAESQAAPGAIWVALDYLDRVRGVTLIAPLGLTAHILGVSSKTRLAELKRRAFLSAMQFAQSPLYDLRNFYLSALMLHAVLYDARWNVSGQKYAVGSSHDLREECRNLASQLYKKGTRLTLILGERDKLFPPSEIVASIEEATIQPVNIIVLETSHASLATRGGRHILSEAVRAVRQENSSHAGEDGGSKTLKPNRES